MGLWWEEQKWEQRHPQRVAEKAQTSKTSRKRQWEYGGLEHRPFQVLESGQLWGVLVVDHFLCYQTHRACLDHRIQTAVCYPGRRCPHRGREGLVPADLEGPHARQDARAPDGPGHCHPDDLTSFSLTGGGESAWTSRVLVLRGFASACGRELALPLCAGASVSRTGDS